MRAAGYFRVSDEDQVEGYSLDAQRRAFGEFCRDKGWERVEEYCEEGRSAWVESIAKRPTFRQMLEDAQARRFDVLVTHTLDRFSRNLRVMLEAFHIFAQSDVTYVSITQEIDYSKPEGRLFMTMLGAFAQYFSDALSGHTKKGMRERAQQGLFNGEPPFGYERCDADCFGLDDSHPGCHTEPEKASIVVQVFERYASGTDSMSGLATWLNDLGFRTKGKRKADVFGELVEVQGRHFTHWSVRDILKNPFYFGKVRYKEELFDGRHHAIVTQNLFDGVQEQMKKNRSRKTPTANGNKPNPHLLTGLLRCHECGTVLWSQKQGTQPGTYYKSPDKGLGQSCKHKGRSFSGRDFDTQTGQLFSGFTLRENWVDWIIENHVREADPQEAIQRRRSIQEKVERARHLYINGDLTWQGFTKIKNDAEAALVSIYVPEFDDAVQAGELLSDFGTIWETASVARRNRLLKSMLHAIYVDLDKREVVGLLPKETFMAPIMAMAERSDVSVLDASRDSFSRNGGDGGESNSPSRRAHKPNVLQACPPVCSWTLRAPPAQPGETQPVDLWPPLPASGWPHPGLMAPGIPASGHCREQT